MTEIVVVICEDCGQEVRIPWPTLHPVKVACGCSGVTWSLQAARRERMVDLPLPR